MEKERVNVENNNPRIQRNHKKRIHPRGNPNQPRQDFSPGNIQKTFERYMDLAKSAISSGDDIAAENYFQHAEHYLRTMHMSALSEVDS